MSNISINNLDVNDTENLLVPVSNNAENLISAAISRSLETRKVMGAGVTPIGIDGGCDGFGFTVGFVGIPLAYIPIA
jgi:hypothetical protein